MLVVLPMLTWIGNTPVDDTGDGLADTLDAGSAVQLNRPLVDGPPASVADDAALLPTCDQRPRTFQLTTDVALAEGHGPSLVDRWGVLFPDGEDLPAGDAGERASRGFVRGGGARARARHRHASRAPARSAAIPADPQAAAPVTTKTDLFGAQRGPLTSTEAN